jgi:hypothetical protein
VKNIVVACVLFLGGVSFAEDLNQTRAALDKQIEATTNQLLECDRKAGKLTRAEEEKCRQLEEEIIVLLKKRDPESFENEE